MRRYVYPPLTRGIPLTDPSGYSRLFHSFQERLQTKKLRIIARDKSSQCLAANCVVRL